MDLFLYDRDIRHERVNIIVSYIFPENLIKIHESFGFSSSTLAIFVNL